MRLVLLCLLLAGCAGAAEPSPERTGWLSVNADSPWADAVRNEGIVPGMPRDVLLASWGQPGSATRVVTTESSDVWMYWYNYAEVYLTNGRISSIWHR